MNKNSLQWNVTATLFGLLFLGATAGAQEPAEDWFSALHNHRLQAAELTLSQATFISPVAPALRGAQPQESQVATQTVPVWARGLSSAQWGMMVESFRAEGVPLELLAVGWVESRFDPAARVERVKSVRSSRALPTCSP